MTPDINLKDYYYNFINDSKRDIIKYNDKLKTLYIELEDIHKLLSDNSKQIYNDFKIDINNFDEFINKKYNEDNALFNSVIKFKKNNDVNRMLLISIYRYCSVIKQIHTAHIKINIANKRKDIKFSKFRELVTKYYNKVHEVILNGYGYKYGYGIGTYCINRWKVVGDARAKTKIDFAATNKRKKELLAQGIKLYDDKIAEWYKARNIPYDGVDYRVYRSTDYYYDFTFIHSSILTRHSRDFERSEYVHAKYRGKSYQEIAEEFVKEDKDIYSLRLDLKYKLNILLYRNPNKYINFIRNAEQVKYKY